MNRKVLVAAALVPALSACGDEAAFGFGGRDAVEPAAPRTLREWRAEAAMISNHGVYRDGEFVYQDYVTTTMARTPTGWTASTRRWARPARTRTTRSTRASRPRR